MVVSNPKANQGTISELLRFSFRSFLHAVTAGLLLWVAVVVCLHLTSASLGNDRLLRLLCVMANQVGFFLMSACGLSWRLTRKALVDASATGGLCMLTAVMLGLLYDSLLRWLFGTGTPTLGPWGEVRLLDGVFAGAIIVLGVVLGPAGDERFFRASLFGTWQAAGRPWSGAFVSSTLFAIARLDAANLVAYFGLGLLLCSLYRWTGSVLAAWVAHALLNATMFALLFCGYE